MRFIIGLICLCSCNAAADVFCNYADWEFDELRFGQLRKANNTGQFKRALHPGLVADDEFYDYLYVIWSVWNGIKVVTHAVYEL